MYEKGILHRDISFGNILICDDDMKDAGMLIDLDHAKYSAKIRAVPLEKETEADEGTEADVLRLFLQRRSSKLVLGPDVLSKTLKFFDDTIHATTYLRHVFDTLPECLRNDNDTTIIWTADKLYWPHQVNLGFLSLLGVFTDITMKDQTGNP
jgi:serine/threonine protein kinase